MIDLLRALASNLRWSWHTPTQALFAAADPDGFQAARGNPYTWLAAVGDEGAVAAFEAAGLGDALSREAWALQEYLDAPCIDAPPVAYFCMEYGLHESLAIYSGGLGILAGDHVKQASDSRLDFVALGFLYTDGYLKQEIDAKGRQVSGSSKLVRGDHPLVKLDNTVMVNSPVGELHADVYEVRVGRSRLLLLDPDVDRNTNPALRSLCRRLYGGDSVTRIRQELLLGIGGHRLLVQLGLDGRVLHMNEGHCAFALAEAVRAGEAKSGDRDAAVAAIQSRAVFTTHTPVPAGHDRFGPKLARAHVEAAFAEDADFVEWALEQAHEEDTAEDAICMTVLALNLADRRNGVSEIHGRVSREQWPGFEINYVTNGVHVGSWVADEIVQRTSDDDIWAIRNELRRRLIAFARKRLLAMPKSCRTGTPEALRDDILTIGFARRFAPYKRANLLLQNKKRLVKLLTNEDRPVQILFAGKAHPADGNGKKLIQEVVRAAKSPKFGGRIHLLPDYDMEVGRMMVMGCDVWLNNPRRPLEASGTSGQKAAMNGCLNLSVPDGWWPEGYDGSNGWEIGPDVGEADDDIQDKADIKSLFELLTDTVAPLFYDRNDHGESAGWSNAARRSIGTITAGFSAERMLNDYIEQYYKPAGS